MLLSALLVLAQEIQGPPQARLELPAGPLADALALMGPATAPSAALAPGGRAPEVSSALDSVATWEAWGADLRALGQGDEAARGLARARLALVALEQERSDDAWAHLAASRGDEALLAALLPRFMPGAPAGAPLAGGGLCGALPDGVELRPALPHEPRLSDSMRWAPRVAKVDGLEVGKARIGIEVSVEGEGVQVVVRHQGGEAANLKVRIPRHPSLAIEAEFVDWWQQDRLGEAWELDLAPGGEEHVLYGRFKAGSAARSLLVPSSVPRQLAEHGLSILVEPGCAQARALEAFATALSSGVGVASSIVDKRPESGGAAAPLLVDWSDSATRLAEWPHLAGRVERFLLR
jgi:hypothetical protein